MFGEFELIDWIARRSGKRLPPEILRSIGDDCAIIGWGGRRLAVTKDVLAENIHFRRRWIGAGLLGRKSLAVNLSDLAAVGARPLGCLLALSVPRELGPDWAQAFLTGFLDAARDWGCPLIGGDLSGAERVHVSVTALGLIKDGEPLCRDQAQDGDKLAVIGDLGRARLGLRLLEIGGLQGPCWESLEQLDGAALDLFEKTCLRAHLAPAPLVEAGAWVREQDLAHAMIDVSDGLAGDLMHLARGSKLEAIVDVSALELFRGPWSERMSLDDVLNGGEDYALLLAASKSQLDRLLGERPPDFPPIREIGVLRKGSPALWIDDASGRRMFEPRGFDHFR